MYKRQGGHFFVKRDDVLLPPRENVRITIDGANERSPDTERELVANLLSTGIGVGIFDETNNIGTTSSRWNDRGGYDVQGNDGPRRRRRRRLGLARRPHDETGYPPEKPKDNESDNDLLFRSVTHKA